MIIHLLMATSALVGDSQHRGPSKLLPNRVPPVRIVCGSGDLPQTPWTPSKDPSSNMVRCAANGTVESLEALLNQGFSPQSRALIPEIATVLDKLAHRPCSALSAASRKGRFDNADLLVKHGALRNLSDEAFLREEIDPQHMDVERVLRWLGTDPLPPRQAGRLIGMAVLGALLHEDWPLIRSLDAYASFMKATPHHLTLPLSKLLASLKTPDPANVPKYLDRLTHFCDATHPNLNLIPPNGSPAIAMLPPDRASLALPVLLDHGLDPNLHWQKSYGDQKEYDSLMGLLVGAGNIKAARILLQKGARAHALPSEGHPLFQSPMYRLADRRVEEIDPAPPTWLPEAGIKGGTVGGVVGGVVGGTKSLDDPRSTPEQTIKFLLEELRANANDPHSGGSLPLATAFAKGRLDIVQALVNHDAKLPAKTNERVEGELAQIAKTGDVELLQFALQAFPKQLPVQGRNGYLALCGSTTTPMVKALLKAGAPPRIAGENLPSPVANAVSLGHPGMLEALLDAGCDPDPAEVGETGIAPLAEASWSDKAEWLGGLLLRKGANPNFEDAAGTTPLMSAIRGGGDNLSSLDHLREWGVNPSAPSKLDGWTPLMEAVVCDRLLSAEWLRAHGADPQARNIDGERAFEVAQRSGRKELVYLLNQEDPLPHAWVKEPGKFDSGRCAQLNQSLLNSRDKLGRTALHLAIGLSRWQEANILIHLENMELNAKDLEGHTALDLLGRSSGPQAMELRRNLQDELETRAEAGSKVGKDKKSD